MRQLIFSNYSVTRVSFLQLCVFICWFKANVAGVLNFSHIGPGCGPDFRYSTENAAVAGLHARSFKQLKRLGLISSAIRSVMQSCEWLTRKWSVHQFLLMSSHCKTRVLGRTAFTLFRLPNPLISPNWHETDNANTALKAWNFVSEFVHISCRPELSESPHS